MVELSKRQQVLIKLDSMTYEQLVDVLRYIEGMKAVDLPAPSDSASGTTIVSEPELGSNESSTPNQTNGR